MSRSVVRAVLVTIGLLVVQLSQVDTQQGPARRATARTNTGAAAARGEALVRFRDAPTATLRRGPIAAYVDADVSTTVGRRGVHLFRSRTFDVDGLVNFLRTQPDVVYAEPNYVLRAVATPNDQYFPLLWSLLNTGQAANGTPGLAGADIDATKAWDVSTGSRSIVVGVIDTGIDDTHPDLAANVWTAPTSFSVVVGGSTITCAAGSHGFNAITSTCNPRDDHYHGTHVSGTIGAVGNNGIGVAGVNWTTSLIGAKFLDANGNGFTDDAIKAIEFLIQTKAAFAPAGAANIRVLNNSWGGGEDSQALGDEIAVAGANEMLFVAAAGNNGTNNDVLPFYPAAYPAANLLAVAATDSHDGLVSFSNYGAAGVDLAAPGVNIASTVPGGYAYLSGTSMAAPHVSGAAALVLSRCTLTTTALRQTLLNTVDALGSLAGLVSSNGRLNVDRALRSCAVPAAPLGLTATGADARVTLSWAAVSGATSYRVQRSGTTGGPYTTVATGVTTTSYTDSGLTNGVPYFYVVTAVNAAGEGTASPQATATPKATRPLAPTGLTVKTADGLVTLTWSPTLDADGYKVKRSTVSGGPYTVIAAPVAATFADGAVTNGTTYYYRLTAVNEAGESKLSKQVTAKPAPVPQMPTGLVVSPGPTAGTVALTWSATTWATSYKVYRATSATGSFSSRKTVTVTSATDTGTSGRRYYYAVTAINQAGSSQRSAAVSVVVP
jgi:subtilisin family serine protease